jgi:hypothetical protein
MTCVKSLTRVLDFLFESSLSPAKKAKRLESDSDESLTRPNTSELSFLAFSLVGDWQNRVRAILILLASLERNRTRIGIESGSDEPPNFKKRIVAK